MQESKKIYSNILLSAGVDMIKNYCLTRSIDFHGRPEKLDNHHIGLITLAIIKACNSEYGLGVALLDFDKTESFKKFFPERLPCEEYTIYISARIKLYTQQNTEFRYKGVVSFQYIKIESINNKSDEDLNRFLELEYIYSTKEEFPIKFGFEKIHPTATRDWVKISNTLESISNLADEQQHSNNSNLPESNTMKESIDNAKNGIGNNSANVLNNYGTINIKNSPFSLGGEDSVVNQNTKKSFFRKIIECFFIWLLVVFVL